MWKPSLRTSTLFFLSGILALGSAACSSNNFAIFSGESTNAAPAAPSIRPGTSPSPEKPILAGVLEKTPTTDTYKQAIDAATGAITISKSAVSPEDWSLVASQWQQAINSLKAVPGSRNIKPTVLLNTKLLGGSCRKIEEPSPSLTALKREALSYGELVTCTSTN